MAAKILAMQRSLGNQTVQQMASTCPAFPSACPTGGACHTCPARVQAKLAVSQPGDVYEQEADRVAEQVMRMPGSRTRRENAGHDLVRSSPVPSIVHEVLHSPGQPLDPDTRAFMEPRFGHDFSQVRVHTGARAAESASAVNALAYTVGQAVIFADGQYAPGTLGGRELLAHELAHVVQQLTPNAPMPTAGPSPSHDSRYEQEADAAAAAVKADTPVRVVERAAPQVQRAAPAAAAPAAALVLLKRCVIGALLSMAIDAAIQYGIHLWRLRRWPWERAREAWEAYRHNWCSTALSAVLGCFGAIAAHRWVQPLLRRYTPLGGAAGATLLGRLLMWLATQAILVPRMVVKWLGKLGCITAFEAESLYPGITSEEALAEAPAAIPAGSAGPESPA